MRRSHTPLMSAYEIAANDFGIDLSSDDWLASFVRRELSMFDQGPLSADPFPDEWVETEQWGRAFEALFEEVVEADERDVETIQEETAEEMQRKRQRVNNSSASAIIQRLDRLSEIVREETTEEIQGMTEVD